MSTYPDNINQIIKAANEKYDFVDAELAEAIVKKLLPFMRKMHLDKGDVLLHLGDAPNKLVFINTGLLRKMYFDHDDSYKTHLFWTENSFFSEGVMLGEMPSDYIIDALEDTEITYIYLDDLEKIIYENSGFMRVYIKFSESELINFITESLRFNVNANERYRNFLEKYPSLDGRISQQDIANYLGISPVSLSRLKRNL